MLKALSPYQGVAAVVEEPVVRIRYLLLVLEAVDREMRSEPATVGESKVSLCVAVFVVAGRGMETGSSAKTEQLAILDLLAVVYLTGFQ